MGTTSPDNIYYPNGTSGIDNIQGDMAQMASSVQAALTKRATQTFEWANSAGRTGQTGMRKGAIGFQADTGEYWVYSGSAWLFYSSMGRTSASVSAASGFMSGCTVYRHNGVLTFTGGLAPTGNGTFNGTMKNVATLPSGFRPINNERVAVAHNLSDTVIDCMVNASGIIQMRVLAGPVNYSTNTAISFAGAALVAGSS